MITDEDFELFKTLVDRAGKQHDGHLAILKFTTNWRVGFKTPADREDIDEIPVGATFSDAAQKALAGDD